MAKTNVGVVIGRFQVPKLSEAHEAVLRSVVNEHKQDRCVVLLGISPTDGRTAENPLTYEQRLRHFTPLGVSVFPIADCTTDEEWSANVDRLLLSVFPIDKYNVILFGGRKSFRESYKGMLPCADVGIQYETSGTDVRAAVKENMSPDFLAGQVYALQQQYPRCFPTVDTIVWRYGNGTGSLVDVLLIQRQDNDEWGFIGGFVDPTDESYERAALREVYEEVGLATVDGVVTYVGSTHVNDWRYRGSRDGITTALFLMQFSFGAVKINPTEVQDYQWVSVLDVEKHLSATHSPLWKKARNILVAKATLNDDLPF